MQCTVSCLRLKSKLNLKNTVQVTWAIWSAVDKTNLNTFNVRLQIAPSILGYASSIAFVNLTRFILVRYVAAYLLAVLGGNASPSNADLEKILSSVGIEVDATRVTKIISELKGKSIDELIAQGREKLSSMPTGGAAAAAPAAAGKLK